MRRISSVTNPHKKMKLSTWWDKMMMIREVLQEKKIMMIFMQHFEAYLTDTYLSSQFRKQNFIVTAQNLDA
jgi:hypothetical protein